MAVCHPKYAGGAFGARGGCVRCGMATAAWVEVARVFGRLGLTAFGGPAAHIAAMEDECVRRRRWVTADAFADLVGAANLIPGPNSTELAIHLGYRRAGWSGLFAAGVSFVLPAVLLVWGLAAAYTMAHESAVWRVRAAAMLAGMQPVVLAVVVQALWRLRASLVRTRWAAALAMASLAAVLVGVSELAVLALSLVVSVVRAGAWTEAADDDAHPSARPVAGLLLGAAAAPLPVAATTTAAAAAMAPAMAPWSILLAFAKIGSVLFGSGYVLLSFLRGEFVVRQGVLTDAQLLDAIAVGQITPGPVFSAATFVGYLVGGPAGALAATVGIFLPAFVAVALTAPFVARLRSSHRWSSALDGVNAVSLALMTSVVLLMARTITPDPVALAILALSAVVLLCTQLGSGWVLLAGAVAGVLRTML